jgi:hypothetical protein
MSESRTERRAIVPSAAGGITRLAYALAEDKGTDVDILLRKSGLSRHQIRDPNARLELRRASENGSEEQVFVQKYQNLLAH